MLALPEALTIHNIKEIQDQLLNYFQQTAAGKKQDVILDAALLQDIDAAGLQLLLSADKTCRLEGRSLSILNKNELIKHLLEISGGSDIVYKEEVNSHE